MWALFIGPLQVSYIAAGGDFSLITDTDIGLVLAANHLVAVQSLIIPGYEAIAYGPYNTYAGGISATGSYSSVENCVSALASMNLFHSLLVQLPNSQYAPLLPQVETIITGLTAFIKSAYNATNGYFYQAGGLTSNGSWEWNNDPVSGFAVDCQTWTISVLGADTIDGWFGPGTTLQIWNTTKRIAGYGLDSNGNVQGVGYTSASTVFSGEWSFGAINMLNIIARQYNATNPSLAAELLSEAAVIRTSINQLLTQDVSVRPGLNSEAVLYANYRYYIPWGWWANPLPATASTAWAVMVD